MSFCFRSMRESENPVEVAKEVRLSFNKYYAGEYPSFQRDGTMKLKVSGFLLLGLIITGIVSNTCGEKQNQAPFYDPVPTVEHYELVRDAHK
jgi:hypothetical protein